MVVEYVESVQSRQTNILTKYNRNIEEGHLVTRRSGLQIEEKKETV